MSGSILKLNAVEPWMLRIQVYCMPTIFPMVAQISDSVGLISLCFNNTLCFVEE